MGRIYLAWGLVGVALSCLPGCGGRFDSTDHGPSDKAIYVNLNVDTKVKATFDLKLPPNVAEQHLLPVNCRGELRSAYKVTKIPDKAGWCRYEGKVELVVPRPDGNGKVGLESKELKGEVEGRTDEGIKVMNQAGMEMVARYHGLASQK